MATRQLEIRRIYSSSPYQLAATTRTSRSTRISILGLLSLLAGMSWIYITWWPADRLIYANMTRSIMIPNVEFLGLDRMFQKAPRELADPAPPEGTEAVVKRFRPPKPPPRKKLTVAQSAEIANSQKILAGLGYGWLTISTGAALWLALCGGAGIATIQLAGESRRRPILLSAGIAALLGLGLSVMVWQDKSVLGMSESAVAVLVCACAAAFAWIVAWALPSRFTATIGSLFALMFIGVAWWVWRTYGAGFPNDAGRLGAVAGAVVVTLIGSAFSRRVIRLHRWAVIAVFAATAATVIVLFVAHRYDAVRTHELSAAHYAGIAAAQSAYAWLLLALLALRIR